MNEKEINNARIEYKIRSNKRKAKKSKLKQIKSRIKYLIMYDKENSNRTIKKETLTETFRKYGLNTKNSEKIYVFIGSYIPENSPVGYRLSILENPPWEYFNKYRNLETEEIIDIDKTDVPEFEKNNTIVKSKIPTSLVSPNAYTFSFYAIQQKYYQALNYTNQDNAIKYIKARTKLPLQRRKISTQKK